MADGDSVSPTDNSVSVGNTSTAVLPANPTRSFLFLQNDSVNVIYAQIDGTPAALNVGIRLNANGGSFQLDSNDIPQGAVNAISAVGGSNLLAIQG